MRNILIFLGIFISMPAFATMLLEGGAANNCEHLFKPKAKVPVSMFPQNTLRFITDDGFDISIVLGGYHKNGAVYESRVEVQIADYRSDASFMRGDDPEASIGFDFDRMVIARDGKTIEFHAEEPSGNSKVLTLFLRKPFDGKEKFDVRGLQISYYNDDALDEIVELKTFKFKTLPPFELVSEYYTGAIAREIVDILNRLPKGSLIEDIEYGHYVKYYRNLRIVDDGKNVDAQMLNLSPPEVTSLLRGLRQLGLRENHPIFNTAPPTSFLN